MEMRIQLGMIHVFPHFLHDVYMSKAQQSTITEADADTNTFRELDGTSGTS